MMNGRGSFPFRARSIFRGKAPKNQDIPPGESRKIIDSKVPVKDDDDDDDDDRVCGNLWNPPPLHNVKLRGKTYIPSHHGTTGTRWLPVRLRPTWRSWKRVWNAYSAMVSTRWMSLVFFPQKKTGGNIPGFLSLIWPQTIRWKSPGKSLFFCVYVCLFWVLGRLMFIGNFS